MTQHKTKGTGNSSPPSKRPLSKRDSTTPAVNGDGKGELRNLLQRLLDPEGEPEDIAAFRRQLELFPDVRRKLGDLTDYTRSKLAATAAEQTAAKEAMKAEADAMEAELLADCRSPTERLLTRHLVTCWMDLQSVEFQASAARTGTVQMRTVEHWGRAVAASQKRFLQAVETLERVRRIRRASPIVVNVAEQQVNLM